MTVRILNETLTVLLHILSVGFHGKPNQGKKIKSWKEELINLKDDVLCLSEVVRVEEVQDNATLRFLIQYLMH